MCFSSEIGTKQALMICKLEKEQRAVITYNYNAKVEDG